MLTKCKFNDTIKSRIIDIIQFANDYRDNPNYPNKNDDPNFKELKYNFVEIQLYILVCRNQITNRGIGLDFFGKIGSSIF